MAKKIKIVIDGSLVVYETSGIKGQGCEQFGKFLDNLGKVKSDKKTGDYYKEHGVKANEQLRG